MNKKLILILILNEMSTLSELNCNRYGCHCYYVFVLEVGMKFSQGSSRLSKCNELQLIYLQQTHDTA
jgi:hypothetical protein